MAIERVHYFDRQFLRVEDFADEQSYHVAMRRRHNISHHSWGIVSGLEPQFVDGVLWLTPGVAIDGFGRELVSDHAQRLPDRLFADLQADELRVWIYYSTRTVAEVPEGYAAGNDGPRYDRLAEQIRIELLRSNPNATPRRPDSVLDTDLAFDATRAAPEDRSWPVFLGTITANAGNALHPYSVDLSGRPYAGLIGEAVVAPSGGARVQVGGEKPGDPSRFAVYVPASDTNPRLAVNQDGTLTARGETTLLGNLEIAGGALEIGAGPALNPQPWHLYRVEEVDDSGAQRSELRLEMDGGGNGSNQIVFGAWSEKEAKFKPALTIADDGTVTVAGNLVVQGMFEGKPGSVVAGDTRAAAMPDPLQHIRELAVKITHNDEEHLHTFAEMIKSDFQGVATKLRKLLEE